MHGCGAGRAVLNTAWLGGQQGGYSCEWSDDNLSVNITHVSLVSQELLGYLQEAASTGVHQRRALQSSTPAPHRSSRYPDKSQHACAASAEEAGSKCWRCSLVVS